MGDKSLMEKILIIISLLCVSLYADLSVKQIENMISKIHLKREGVKLETLEATKEPFVRLKEENNVSKIVIPEKREEAELTLHAIVNGKAYINDTWKAIDDTIMGYTLKYVGKRGVVLRKDNTIKKLFLHQERDDFITLEER
jgi:cephalosporin-C deacetylase-like acetyl esterase